MYRSVGCNSIYYQNNCFIVDWWCWFNFIVFKPNDCKKLCREENSNGLDQFNAEFLWKERTVWVLIEKKLCSFLVQKSGGHFSSYKREKKHFVCFLVFQVGFYQNVVKYIALWNSSRRNSCAQELNRPFNESRKLDEVNFHHERLFACWRNTKRRENSREMTLRPVHNTRSGN